MLSRHGRPRLLSCLTLILAPALLYVNSYAQTAAAAQAAAANVAPAEAATSESPAGVTTRTTPPPAAKSSATETTQAAAPIDSTAAPAEAERAPAKADAAPAETDSAKSDPAKGDAAPAADPAAQPEALPQPAAAAAAPAPAQTPAPPTCNRTVTAEVVALAQPYMLNRLGASMPNALVYALRGDVLIGANNVPQLKPWKRARPIVLRANEGDCLKITFYNWINLNSPGSTTPPVSLHAQGMQAANNISDDGSFVGANKSSLADPVAPAANPNPATGKVYTLFAQHEGTFLLYSEGDSNTAGQQLFQGLFGAVNVQPAGAEWYRSQVTKEDLDLASGGHTPLNQPIVKYDARYPANYADKSRACTPILMMAAPEMVAQGGKCVAKLGGAKLKLYHTDLTAIITGPKAGRFPGTTGVGNPEPDCDKAGQPNVNVNPLFCHNPASPDRKQPYREVTVIYHEVFPSVIQAFKEFMPGDPLYPTTIAGRDDFAINYGTGGIGAEIYANRIHVGPMANCVTCKYEEFFLSSWGVGDPATVVDVPANYVPPPTTPPPPCKYNALKPSDTFNPKCIGKPTADPPAGPKATMAFYPDDPSNVYHSYLNDHVKFRILHGGTGVTHVHHQHAHQWLQSPNTSDGSYLDSQFISPGASYTLEMVYNGSGNRNKTIGDSIFHCHFYPHFAEGMWAMWRVHDVFEAGTQLDAGGKPASGSRALPDGEISAGTPIPALVPLPTMPMALMPSPVFIDNGQIAYGTPGSPVKPEDVKDNPGYPFFVPGIAGQRAPHPPMDFAQSSPGVYLDGGLPRNVVTGGHVSNQKETNTDWSKDFDQLNATQLPEAGTPVEQVAIAYNGVRCRKSFLPDGSSTNPFGPTNYPECANPNDANFILNGLPRKTAQNPSGAQMGSPYADPAVDDQGNPVGKQRTYKAAAIQMDLPFNEKGFHYQQQRLLTLWEDVTPTLKGARKAEPFFFRANSQDDFIEYWHTNLVPGYYEVDAFQVRTPTDILGQHIHLVKFDVTSSDGAGNGWNYEDGTLAPGEVQEMMEAVHAPGGSWTACASCPPLAAAPAKPPKEIFDCDANPNDVRCKPCPPAPGPGQDAPACHSWLGAQTTIQRWYADPFFDNDKKDNTIRTVFTHDHFGPSTHQQAGLYAGLLVEPRGSTWRTNEGDALMGTRPDGGPTSWQARILTQNDADSYREFALEYQDLTLAYWPIPGAGGSGAINPPGVPSLISTGGQPPPGTQTVNYYNAPLPFRNQNACKDLSYAFDSKCVQGTGAANGDPGTPILRAYENDKVQVRILVGAHTFSHFFTMGGPRWNFEPSWTNSGFRSSQGTGISEHFEMLFNVPPSSIGKSTRKCPEKNGKSQGDCVDYLYSPSDDNFGLTNGVWGLLRAYNPTKPFDELKQLPNNKPASGANMDFAACPANQPADKIRTYNVTAVDAQTFAPGGQIPFNTHVAGTTTSVQSLGLMYVFSEDIDPVTHKLKGPLEPLILRANAGDCIVVNLSNGIGPGSAPMTQQFEWPKPFDLKVAADAYFFGTINASAYVGLHPQLLSYDGATDGGINVGYNAKRQTVAQGEPPITYRWYAGGIARAQNGTLNYTPIEFGSLNLLPSDPIIQHKWALYGGMVIEPEGSKWSCDAVDTVTGKTIGAPCVPTPGFDPSKVKNYTRASATVTPAAGTVFREFVAMMSEDLALNPNLANRSAINYRTEPTYYRYGHPTDGNKPFPPGPDFAPPPVPGGNNFCALSNMLPLPAGNPAGPTGDPQTPIFTAVAGRPVRFRLMHPQGTGTAQVFVLNGHVWQREPYINSSTLIGNNPLSQWLGSHDSHGGTDHYDIVINKAGGEHQVAGDYLYTSFVPNQNWYGSWGVFRVLNTDGTRAPANTTPCPPAPPTTTKPVYREDRNGQDFIRQPLKTVKPNQ
jgi:manganese oxidase